VAPGPLPFSPARRLIDGRDARRGIHVSVRATGRLLPCFGGKDGRRRYDDAGSERREAEHRAAGQGRIVRGVHSADCGSVVAGQPNDPGVKSDS